ncbi:MAG: uncharacterized protein A8A55_0394 [Amphiamblys sp. WSBS2006]|nr:MAG: uncharacterized protein A8A55_0394 [Amphiamblys sp. WSBS2006]
MVAGACVVLFLLKNACALLVLNATASHDIESETGPMLVGFAGPAPSAEYTGLMDALAETEFLFKEKKMKIKAVLMACTDDAKYAKRHQIRKYPSIAFIHGQQTTIILSHAPEDLVDTCSRLVQHMLPPLNPVEDRARACEPACTEGIEEAAELSAHDKAQPTFRQLREMERQEKMFILLLTCVNSCRRCNIPTPYLAVKITQLLKEKKIDSHIACVDRNNHPAEEADEIFQKYNAAVLPKIMVVKGIKSWEYKGERNSEDIVAFYSRISEKENN